MANATQTRGRARQRAYVERLKEAGHERVDIYLSSRAKRQLKTFGRNTREVLEQLIDEAYEFRRQHKADHARFLEAVKQEYDKPLNRLDLLQQRKLERALKGKVDADVPLGLRPALAAMHKYLPHKGRLTPKLEA